MKKTLYLGLDPSRYPCVGELVHLPLIQIAPRPFEGEIEQAFKQLTHYSHILFTSRTAVTLYVLYCTKAGVCSKVKTNLAIGKATAKQLEKHHLCPTYIAEQETAEGMVSLLKTLPLNSASLFFPRSSLGRDVIQRYLKEAKITFKELTLYDTLTRVVIIPSLEDFDEIVFTSPSTVTAFIQLAGTLPPLEKCVALGLVTRIKLEEVSF